MVIDVTGFGWSGSGAVHDLLREYDDLEFAAYHYDWEFTLLWEVDGIYDLENKLCQKHCRYADSNMAIKRFLELTNAQNKTASFSYNTQFKGNYKSIIERYVDDLVQVYFYGHSSRDILFPDKKEFFLNTYNRVVNRLFGNKYVTRIFGKDFSRILVCQNKHKIYLSYNPERFLERTHQLMEDLFSYVRKDNDLPLVTDQLFPPDCPNLFFKYINEPIKSIIVRRDPRDTYLLAKQAYHSNMPIPVQKVEDFILFYKKTIEETRIDTNNNVLNVRFEDLIYNYEETKHKIEVFLGIKQHVRIKQKFNPSTSINNTQLFNLYDGYEQDIKKIEEALPNSLFPFEKYGVLGKNRKEVF